MERVSDQRDFPPSRFGVGLSFNIPMVYRRHVQQGLYDLGLEGVNKYRRRGRTASATRCALARSAVVVVVVVLVSKNRRWRIGQGPMSGLLA